MKTSLNGPRPLLLGTLVAAMSIGCATNADSDAETGEEQEIVVGLNDLPNRVSVLDGRLEFDAEVIPSLEKGGILAKLEKYAAAPDKNAKGVEAVYFVGDRESDALEPNGMVKLGVRNPKGYLRRGLSFTKAASGKLVVLTEPATFAEALEDQNGFLSLSLRDGAGDGIRTQAEGDVTDFTKGNFTKTLEHVFDEITPIEILDKEIFQKKMLIGNGEAKLTLKRAKISIKPRLDAHFVIEGFKAREASAFLTTVVEGDLDIVAKADGVFKLAPKTDTLFSRSWGVMVGNVPLTLSVDVSSQCEFDFSARANMTVGAHAFGNFHLGGQLENGNLRGVLDKPEYRFERRGPTADANAELTGACHLITNVGLQFFDVAGPDGEADVFAKVVGHASGATGQGVSGDANLVAGVKLSAGGSLRPFGVRLGDINVPAATFQKELFNGKFNQ